MKDRQDRHIYRIMNSILSTLNNKGGLIEKILPQFNKKFILKSSYICLLKILIFKTVNTKNYFITVTWIASKSQITATMISFLFSQS